MGAGATRGGQWGGCSELRGLPSPEGQALVGGGCGFIICTL